MTEGKFTNKIEGYVPAGGKSSRMGVDKAFLPVGGETFLEHAVNALLPVCPDRVKIILNRTQAAEKFSGYVYVRDVFEERGAPGAIHAGLFDSQSEWTVVLACDMPLVTSDTIKVLAEAALTAPPDTAAIVPQEASGRIQPLCAIYRTPLCLPPLTELLASKESVSVLAFLQTVAVFYLETEKTPIQAESVFFNVNTPQDLAFLSKK